MTTIVTRAGKGSALTWTEGDSNFSNLNTAKLENVVEDTTPQLGGNLDVNGNAITSASNGNVRIEPNGSGNIALTPTTGKIILGALDWPTSTGTNGQVLTTNGSSAASWTTVSGGGGGLANVVEDLTPQLGGNLDVNGQSIVSTSNANITITPDGTGDVILSADRVQVGDSGAAATITTNGAGNLVLNTNSGTNSGAITINQGTNGTISVNANGTGIVTVGSPTFGIFLTSPGANIAPFTGRHATTASASDTLPSFIAQKHRTDIALASMTDEPVVYQFTVRDSSNTNRHFGRWIGRFQGTSTDPTFTLRGSADSFTTNNHYATFKTNQALLGTGTDYTITSGTGGALKLTANADTSSGVITVASGADGNISIAPNGTGDVQLDADTVRVGDSGAAATITTNGAGNLTLSTNDNTSTGSITINAGANGNIAISPIGTGNIQLTPATGKIVLGALDFPTGTGTNGQVLTTNGSSALSFTTISSGISNVVEDTTPQLGGNLDVNGNAIVSASNGNIRLEPNGSGNIALTPATGKIILGALDWPTTTGTNGQVLTTNGSSAATWTTVSAGGGAQSAFVYVSNPKGTLVVGSEYRAAIEEWWDPSGIISVASNTITCAAAGTYSVEMTMNEHVTNANIWQHKIINSGSNGDWVSQSGSSNNGDNFAARAFLVATGTTHRISEKWIWVWRSTVTNATFQLRYLLNSTADTVSQAGNVMIKVTKL